MKFLKTSKKMIVPVKNYIFSDRTSCAYPAKVEETGQASPLAGKRLPFDESINLSCGEDLDIFVEENNLYRYVVFLSAVVEARKVVVSTWFFKEKILSCG